MRVFLTLFTILCAALLGYHFVFRGRLFHLSGAAFLLVGYLLGPDVSALLDETTTTHLYPLMGLVTGWVGFTYGLQIDLSFFKRFTLPFAVSVAFDTGLTLLIFAAGAMLLLPYLGAVQSLSLALIVSAIAACSSQAALALTREGKLPKNLSNIIRIATAGSLGSLGVFALAFLVAAALPTGIATPIEADMTTIFGTTAALVLLYIFFLSEKRGAEELILIVTGMVVLTSGLAVTHHFSPLLANVVTAFFLGNTTRYRDRILSMVMVLEKPLYLLLLMLLGARTIAFTSTLFQATAIYLSGRTLVKLAGGWMASTLDEKGEMPRLAGTGFLEQGGIAMAICFDAQHAFADPITHKVITAILLATLASDILGRLSSAQLMEKGP